MERIEWQCRKSKVDKTEYWSYQGCEEHWKRKFDVIFKSLATPWTAAYQAPPSMGFSRQEYWSGVPLPSPWIPLGWTDLISLQSKGLSRVFSNTTVQRHQLFGAQLHSSTLAWKIPWTEEPGRLQSMGSLRVGHDWATSLSLFTFTHWRRQWQPTPVFLPGESQGEPGGLPSMGSHRVGHDWRDLAANSILKSWDITLSTKFHLVKSMVFPVVMYGCQSWTIKKAECRRIDAFELHCWTRLLRVPWIARRSN